MIFPTSPVPPPLFSIQTQVKTEEPFYVIVESGEILEQIASEQHTTVQKLFNKNTDIKDPNRIEVGQKLVIPASDEVLTDRPIPTPTPAISPQNAPQAKPSPVGVNMYDAGYCTAYAWSRRPDLPGNLGDGTTWGVRAAAQGFSVDNSPRAGDIGVTKAYNHVVYIEQVNGDGTVYVSEMNYSGTPGGGFNKVSYRTAPASEFTYIH